jgi:hypothetical protein
VQKRRPPIFLKGELTVENSETSYSEKVGNTTFIICVKQSETAKKSLDAVFRDICIHEAVGGFFTSQYSLDELKKSS